MRYLITLIHPSSPAPHENNQVPPSHKIFDPTSERRRKENGTKNSPWSSHRRVLHVSSCHIYSRSFLSLLVYEEIQKYNIALIPKLNFPLYKI